MKDRLKEFVDPILRNAFDPKKLILQLITRKIEAQGIILTEEQKKAIETQLQRKDVDSFKLDISDDQLKTAKTDLKATRSLALRFEDDELPDIHKLSQQVSKAIVSTCQTEVADILAQGWKDQSSESLNLENANLQNFQNEIVSFWGTAIDSLQMLLGITNVNCSEICNDLWQNATQEDSQVIEAITRLHARGCQVAFEILTLLKSGCADGAQARWRTLHEIAVVANFLRESGNDVAERYLLHVDIETYWAAVAHQKHCKTMRYDPIPEDEFAALESRRRELLTRFGKGFDSDYDWARPKFPNLGKKESVRFTDIEECVRLEHVRPAYKMANANVHAGAKGIAYRLGVPAYVDELLAGPSRYGLEEPGKNTAFSLNLLTSALLMIHPTLDSIALLNALRTLGIETYQAFNDAAEKVWALQIQNQKSKIEND